MCSKQAQLCFDASQIKNFTEENLRDLIDLCKQRKNWDLLRSSIELIFSNRLSLSTSFLKKHATAEHDEITLDFEAMKNSINLLLSYEDEILSTIHQSLNRLLTDLLSAKDQTDAHFFNIFFIIFEFSFLSDPMFIYDIARLFYSNLIKLPFDAQTKFVRLLSKYSTNLNQYVSHVQQYITLHTFRWCEKQNRTFNDDDALLSNEPGKSVRRNFTIRLFDFIRNERRNWCVMYTFLCKSVE